MQIFYIIMGFEFGQLELYQYILYINSAFSFKIFLPEIFEKNKFPN